MKNTFDVLDMVFSRLHVTTVTTLIDGKIYRNKRPVNSELKDIVINTLPISNDPNIQQGTFHVNCFVKNLPNGQVDESTLEPILNAVVNRIDGYSASTTYFDCDIVSMSVYPDESSDQWSYGSVRVNYVISNPN